MKRIIAFVLLGLLIYAGGFVIYFAAVDIKINTAVPSNLNYLNTNNFYTGLVAEYDVYQVADKFKVEEKQSTVLGIPFGEFKKQHFYILPIGTSEKYMLIAASDEKDIEALDKLIVEKPHERGRDDPVLKVFGILEEMPYTTQMDLKGYFVAKRPDLIGYGEYYYQASEIRADNHIVRYTFYIKHPSGTDYMPLIVGIAMCVVGIGLAVLLILRIKSEKEGY